jgi:adenylate cyclase
MSFDVFQREETIIAQGRALLAGNTIADPVAAAKYEALLKAYEKLSRTTRRLIKLSDRNEEQLNQLAHTLNEKNATLETLSDKLSKYLAPQIYRSIFLGQHDDSLITRRKKLTVLFSDIKDFTETTEDLEPEDLAHHINNYLTEMSRIALAHGATIDKFIGDAIMMFFGDPESRGVKEDAAACVVMAMEMQRRARELRAQMSANGFERPFQTRIGINTGYCNVGNFGSADRMDYTIIGSAVNLAARLQSHCDPDGILVSYETYVLVRDIVDFEERKPVDLKGIRRKVKTFAVRSFNDPDADASHRFHCDQDGLKLSLDLTKMVGNARAEALGRLEDIVDRLRNLPESALAAGIEQAVANTVIRENRQPNPPGKRERKNAITPDVPTRGIVTKSKSAAPGSARDLIIDGTRGHD